MVLVDFVRLAYLAGSRLRRMIGEIVTDDNETYADVSWWWVGERVGGWVEREGPKPKNR